MKLTDLRGIDQDLKRGIDYNKKHGGSPLKKIMKRPEIHPTSYFNGSINYAKGQWEKIFGKDKKCSKQTNMTKSTQTEARK